MGGDAQTGSRVVAVQVHCSGPDAQLAHAAHASHHRWDGGRTTLSSSGVLLQLPPPDQAGGGGGAPPTDSTSSSTSTLAWVLAPMTLVRPFLRDGARGGDPSSQQPVGAAASLAPGAQLEVLLPRTPSGTGGGRAAPVAAPAQLVGTLQLPTMRRQLEGLLGALNAGAAGAWKLGWQLARDRRPGEATAPATAAAWALLALQPPPGWAPPAGAATDALCACGPAPAQPVRVVGSPFGCLAPAHFHGAVVEGSVAGVLPADSPGVGRSEQAMGRTMLLDAVLHPGMEGGPVLCRSCGGWLGAVLLPLTNGLTQGELLLAAPCGQLLHALSHGQGEARPQQEGAWAASAACRPQHVARGGVEAAALRRVPAAQAAEHGLVQGGCCADAAAVQAALEGVVMVRAGGGWATGVVLGAASGLVLTIAHLFAPPPAAGGGSPVQAGEQLRGVAVRLPDPGCAGGYHWQPARLLHSFQGHLDLAVMQLQPPLLAPLPPQQSCWAAAAAAGGGGAASWWGLRRALPLAPPGGLAEGDPVWVLGHGLLGPRAQLAAAATRGSAARLVGLLGGPPSMLITTAAVHAGASGGAVVDGGGRLVGVMTSNARHASGATLPRLSFAIHRAELAPLWAWAAQAEAEAQAAAAAGGGQQRAGRLGGERLAALRGLDGCDTAAQALWALQDPGPAAGQPSSKL